MAEDSSFIWLRPATDFEAVLNSANKKGYFVTVYGLTLRSAVPLTEDHIKRALLHTFRKVPTLRMCFRKRSNILWACDMNREELNFQVMDTKDVTQAIESLLHHKFPTTDGPLWCARVLPCDATVPSVRPELDADFPHTRLMLLANHHGIADGTTNMFITDAFLHILDNVVTGTAIDDTVQLGRLVAGEETDAILNARKADLEKDENHLKLLMDKIKKLKTEEKLIPRVYPMPMDPNFRCQIVLADLDRETTQRFIKKCKKEQVTVNSGLVAVFNVGLVDFLREGGLEQDEYHINEMHTVSMRRYWSGDTAGTLGVHMMALQNIVSTPAKWRDNFWEYARIVHKKIGQMLQEKEAVMYVIKITLELQGRDKDELFDERPYPEIDYGAANMGNADRLVQTEGRQVRLTHLIRVTSCFNDPMYHLFHTLHGCLMYSLTYANDILTRETAQKLVDKTFENLRTLAWE